MNKTAFQLGQMLKEAGPGASWWTKLMARTFLPAEQAAGGAPKLPPSKVAPGKVAPKLPAASAVRKPLIESVPAYNVATHPVTTTVGKWAPIAYLAKQLYNAGENAFNTVTTASDKTQGAYRGPGR